MAFVATVGGLYAIYTNKIHIAVSKGLVDQHLVSRHGKLGTLSRNSFREFSGIFGFMPGPSDDWVRGGEVSKWRSRAPNLEASRVHTDGLSSRVHTDFGHGLDTDIE